MNDDGRRKLISHAATLEFAAVRRQHILDPSAIRTVGERNQESVGLSKHIHRGAVEFAGLTTYLDTIPKPGKRPTNRMVIRLVTARWNAASRLLQNRTNRMTVRKSATKQMPTAAIIILPIPSRYRRYELGHPATAI